MPKSLNKKNETQEKRARRMTREADIAALHNMQAARPLKPPPMRMQAPTLSAGAAALAKEKRTGVYPDLRAELMQAFGHYQGSVDDARSPAVRL